MVYLILLGTYQLGAHHTSITAYRIIRTGQPQYLAEKLVVRTASQDQVFPARREGLITVNCDLTLSRSGFIYRATKLCNLLTRTLREKQKLRYSREALRDGSKGMCQGNLPRTMKNASVFLLQP